MGSLWTALGSIALSTAVGCAAVPADDEPGLVAQAITGGTLTDRDDAVVALLRGGRPDCSGVLVAPRVVLTAAHCTVADAETEAVFFGDDFTLGGTTLDVLDVERHPMFVDGPVPSHDVALLLLAADAQVTGVPLMLEPVDAASIGRPVRIVGFGHATADGGETGVKRSGDTTVASATIASFTLDSEGPHTCVGDSGGPTFVDVAGVEHVAGIHSFGNDTCDGLAVDVRVDAFAESFVLPAIARLERKARGGDDGCVVARPGRPDRSAASPVAMVCALVVALVTLSRASRRIRRRRRARLTADNRPSNPV